MNKSLNRVADKLLNDSDRFKRLQELGNRKNYPNKIEQLRKKIEEQYNLFLKKESSSKLLDLKRDLDFINTQTNTNFSKEKIDSLVGKYECQKLKKSCIV